MSTDEKPRRHVGAAGRFDRISSAVAKRMGHPTAFVIAVAAVLIWALSGPIFGFSDTWQLVVNTGTTVMTFLMVFLIQNSLNRDSMAIHVKLDELIRVSKDAADKLIGVEQLTEAEIESLEEDEEAASATKAKASAKAAAERSGAGSQGR